MRAESTRRARGGLGRRAGGLLAAALIALVGAGACRDRSAPLVVQPDRVSVVNQTSQDWSQVEIRVNQYYVAQSQTLARGARLDAPLDRFQGGFGRFFDPGREKVRSVVVTATTADGSPVRLTWPETAEEPN